MKYRTGKMFEAVNQRLDNIDAKLAVIGPEYVAARDAIDAVLQQEIAALVANDAAKQEGIEAAFQKAEEARAKLVVPAAP